MTIALWRLHACQTPSPWSFRPATPDDLETDYEGRGARRRSEPTLRSLWKVRLPVGALWVCPVCHSAWKIAHTRECWPYWGRLEERSESGLTYDEFALHALRRLRSELVGR